MSAWDFNARNAKIAYKRYICDVIGLISGLVDKIGLSDIEVCVEVLGMLLETGFRDSVLLKD